MSDNSVTVVDIDQLHQEIFGYIPNKCGTAYERISAIVLAMLGWEGVIHNIEEQPAGRQAVHQLDITATDPQGEIKRLLVECKDWNRKVGQGTVNTLVGVRNQIGADAAVILTTEGFKRGAVNVAVDEDIALIRLAAYVPAKHGRNFATRISVTMKMYTPVHSDFDIELASSVNVDEELQVKLTGADHLLYADGTPAERIFDVLRANASPMEEGAFRQRADLPPGRFVPSIEGPAIEIRALTWTETNHLRTFEDVHEAEGTPVLFMEQLNDKGEGESGQLLVSEKLFAWDIDNQGNVVPRGNLST
jgi:hypothetical protein